VVITRSVARLHKTNPTTKRPIEQGVTPQGNGMAPEPSWQQGNAETGAGAPFSDQESIEGLLRRLIQRVEESERRYDEALGELHARLNRLSQTPEGSGGAISAEEAETLERLREQLSGLARRQQPAPEPAPDHFAALDKALAEFRAVSTGLAAAGPGVLPPRPASPSEPPQASPAPDFPFSTPAPEPDFSVPPPPSFTGEDDFDQRLIDLAQRLEHSVGGAAPAAAIEMLKARMDELAANFEAALQQSPKLESLHRLERQIGDMAQQIGRAEQHIARIGVIESRLQWLIDRVQQAPAEIEGLASKAAADAARLVAEAAAGKPSAAERLEAIHRDLVAMNERGRVTDDRMVDTLEAMHASLKGLAEQLEQPEAPLSQGSAALAEPAGPSVSGGAALVGGDVISSEDQRLSSLRDRLAASDLGFDSDRTTMPFGRAKRSSSLGEATVDLDEMDPARLVPPTAEMPFDSMEDLVAAARRAAQAAAARAEERSAQHQRRKGPAQGTHRDEPERRTRSFLMFIAALLLIISAALLYSRLQSKPDFRAASPVAEQSTLPPGIGVAPAPAPSP
jgi:localization factor PodJL